jgi:hypothetical protein
MTQRICILSQGAGSKMYTLWNHNAGSDETKPEYIKNLSTDYATALLLAEQYCIDTDRQLVNDNMEVLIPTIQVHKWTPTMVRFGKNKGIELSDCDDEFILWVANGCPLYDERRKSFCLYFFGGAEFNKYAIELAILKGIDVVENINE